MKLENGSAQAVDEALKRRNKAAYARAFVRSANGQYIISELQNEVTLLLKELTDRRLDHEEYIEKRAQVAVLRRVMNNWQTDAENLERYQEMYKQRSRENAERIRLEQLQAEAGV